MAKVCCLLTVDDSFEQSSRKVEHILGQKISSNTIERLAHQVGTVALEEAKQELADFRKSRHVVQSQAAPERLYIASDGTTVHERDGWLWCC